MTKKELDELDARLRTLVPDLAPLSMPTRNGFAAMVVLKACAVESKKTGHSVALYPNSRECWVICQQKGDGVENFTDGKTLEEVISQFAIKVLDFDTAP